MESTEFNQKLEELIAKNLPEQTGATLRKVLEKAEKDAKEVERLSKLAEEQTTTIDKLNSRLRSQEELDKLAQDLAAKEKEIDDKIYKQELFELTTKLAAETSKTVHATNVAMGLVRNSVYRKSMFDSENVGDYPVFDGQGNAHYPIPVRKSLTETSEQE